MAQGASRELRSAAPHPASAGLENGAKRRVKCPEWHDEGRAAPAPVSIWVVRAAEHRGNHQVRSIGRSKPDGGAQRESLRVAPRTVARAQLRTQFDGHAIGCRTCLEVQDVDQPTVAGPCGGACGARSGQRRLHLQPRTVEHALPCGHGWQLPPWLDRLIQTVGLARIVHAERRDKPVACHREQRCERAIHVAHVQDCPQMLARTGVAGVRTAARQVQRAVVGHDVDLVQRRSGHDGPEPSWRCLHAANGARRREVFAAGANGGRERT